MPDLLYRAGRTAYERIREHGFRATDVQAFAAPASGPKWLVLAGLDRAIITSKLLGGPAQTHAERTLLVGASAGAWRAMTLASADPMQAHRALEQLYVSRVFARGVTPEEISDEYRRMLAEIFTGPQVQGIVEGDRFDVAVHVTRARGAAGSRRRWVQAVGMVAAAGANLLSARTMRLHFSRLLFHTRPAAWSIPFNGTVLALDAANLPDVALATGSVPLYFEPVRQFADRALGPCVDGGIFDYHLNQCYVRDRDGIVLFPHFQERVVPNWFDRYLARRQPSAGIIDNVLQVYPSPDFVSRLPGGRIPTRDDFKVFIDDPGERIRRWLDVVDASHRLGEQLIEDVEHDRLPELVQLVPGPRL